MKKVIIVLLHSLFVINSFAQKLADGEYYIKVIRHNKYMAIEGAEKANGGKLVQWDFEPQKHFAFIVKNLGGSLYSIQCKNSGRYLSSEGQYPSTGAKLIQWDWLNQDNQKFIILPAENGASGYRMKLYYKYLDIKLSGWNSTTFTPGNGTHFIVDEFLKDAPMLLDFKKNEPGDEPSTLYKQKKTDNVSKTKQSTQLTKVLTDVPDGIYKIRINESGKYLAIAGQEDHSNGMRLIQWDMLPRNNHLFKVTKLDNGNYTIAAVHSEKVLDVVDMRTSDGTQVQQWENLNGSNQQWKFINAGDNKVRIFSVASGKELVLSGKRNDPNNGVSLCIESNTEQTYSLIPARANKFTEYITVRNMEIRSPKTGGDQSLFGNIRIYVINKNDKSKGSYYLSPTNVPFERSENNTYDIGKTRRLILPGEFKFKISSEELVGSKLVIVYSVNENDASVFTTFTHDYNISPGGYTPFEPDLEPMVSGGADDFYVLKNSFSNCLKIKLTPGKFANWQEFYITDIPAGCNVHINMQDEDGSDNWLDVYFDISKQRNN